MAERIQGALIEHEHKTTGQEKVVAANKKVDASFDKTAKSMGALFGPGGVAVIAANQALELARNLTRVAQATGEIAKAGAAAADVAENFAALGKAVPGIEALREATAGVVDDTTLQRWAIWNQQLGATAQETLGAAQATITYLESQGRLAESGEFLTKITQDTIGAAREIGIVVDETTAKYQGLGESQKKLVAFQDIAIRGSQDQVDALDSQSAAVLRADAELKNLESSLQQMAAEFLKDTGLIEAFRDGLESAAKWAEENKEDISELLTIMIAMAKNGVAPLLTVLGFLVEKLGTVVTVVKTMSEVARLATNPLAALKFGAEELGSAIGVWEKAETKVNDALEEQLKWLRDLETQRKKEKGDAHRRAAEAALQTEKDAAAFRAVADETDKRREKRRLKEQEENAALFRSISDETERRKEERAQAADDRRRARDERIVDEAKSLGDMVGSVLRRSAEEEAAFFSELERERNQDTAEAMRERLRIIQEARAAEAAAREQDPLFQQTTETAEAETFITQSEKMAGALDGISDAFGRMQFASDSALDALSTGMAMTAGNLTKMSKAISAAGDDYMGMGLAVGQFAADQASDVIGSQTAQAGIFAAMEFAKGWASLESPVLSAAHFTASALFAGIAVSSAFGAGTRSPRTAGAGDAPGTEAPDFGGTAFDQTGTTQDAPTGGTTIIVQYQTPFAREGYEWMLGNLNDGNRQGTGLQLDASIIRGA